MLLTRNSRRFRNREAGNEPLVKLKWYGVDYAWGSGCRPVSARGSKTRMSPTTVAECRFLVVVFIDGSRQAKSLTYKPAMLND